MLITLVCTIFLAWLYRIDAQECDQIDGYTLGCWYYTTDIEDGSLINIYGDEETLSNNVNATQSGTNYTYFFNPIKDFSLYPDCIGSYICQQDIGNTLSYSSIVANGDTIGAQVLEDGTSTEILQGLYGSNVIVQFVCSEGLSYPQLMNIKESSENAYSFEYYSNCACPGACIGPPVIGEPNIIEQNSNTYLYVNLAFSYSLPGSTTLSLAMIDETTDSVLRFTNTVDSFEYNVGEAYNFDIEYCYTYTLEATSARYFTTLLGSEVEYNASSTASYYFSLLQTVIMTVESDDQEECYITFVCSTYYDYGCIIEYKEQRPDGTFVYGNIFVDPMTSNSKPINLTTSLHLTTCDSVITFTSYAFSEENDLQSQEMYRALDSCTISDTVIVDTTSTAYYGSDVNFYSALSNNTAGDNWGLTDEERDLVIAVCVTFVVVLLITVVLICCIQYIYSYIRKSSEVFVQPLDRNLDSNQLVRMTTRKKLKTPTETKMSSNA